MWRWILLYLYYSSAINQLILSYISIFQYYQNMEPHPTPPLIQSNPQPQKQKHRQRDNYIDKSKYKQPPTSSPLPFPQQLTQPNISKKIKPSYSKFQQRQQLITKSQTQTDQFSHLSLNLQPFLNYQDKVLCKCSRKIKYYCSKCLTSNQELDFPKVELDTDILILHHPEEKLTKSTGLPLCFLSPQISSATFSEEMEPFGEGTYVLYPHKDSIRVDQLTEKPRLLVAIDCTWYQTGSILRVLERQKHLKYVRLEEYQTKFWRYQHHGEQALSTAEAIYYYMKEYYLGYKKSESPELWLDNLLFLFVLNKRIISQYYKQKINSTNTYKQSDNLKELKDQQTEKKEEQPQKQQKQQRQQKQLENR